MVVVATQAFKIGNPLRLVRGVDSYGNMCGESNGNVLEGAAWRDMSSKPYLFFGNPFSPGQLQICMASCPSNFPASLALTRDDVICYEGYTSGVGGLLADTWRYGCWSDSCPCYPRYPSERIIGRCVPSPGVLNTTAKAILSVESSQMAQEMLTDVMTARFVILACAGLALVLSFVWLIVLCLCGGCIVWATLFLTMALLAAFAVISLYFGRMGKQEYEKAKETGDALDRQRYNYIFLLVLGAIFALLFVLFVLAVLFMRKRIGLAIEIVKEAARTIGHVPSMLFFPLFIFVLMAGFLAYWVVVMLYLGTASKPRFANALRYPTEPRRFLEYKTDEVLRRLQGYHVFGGLWTANFLIAMNQIVIAGAVAHHYFREGNSLIRFPLATSLWYTLRYHLGTIAFGSLIIAIVQFIRVLLRYAEEHLKMAKNSDIAKFLLRCLGYAFMCLERFLKFISRNAYVVCAIKGANFCRAARDAFKLLTDNCLRLVAVQFVSGFLIILGKLAVVCAVAVTSVFWLRDMDLQYYIIPVVLIVLISFCIVALFMTVFEMTIDTIFLCVCEDLEHHTGRYMNDDMREFVGKNNKSSSSSSSKK